MMGLPGLSENQRPTLALQTRRLARFGFDLLDHIASEHECEIIVANQETLSPEQEMVEDLLAIVHTFSCRLYGMRKYKKQIKADYPAAREPREDVL